MRVDFIETKKMCCNGSNKALIQNSSILDSPYLLYIKVKGQIIGNFALKHSLYLNISYFLVDTNKYEQICYVR